jgi:hypothetical protein
MSTWLVANTSAAPMSTEDAKKSPSPASRGAPGGKACCSVVNTPTNLPRRSAGACAGAC